MAAVTVQGARCSAESASVLISSSADAAGVRRGSARSRLRASQRREWPAGNCIMLLSELKQEQGGRRSRLHSVNGDGDDDGDGGGSERVAGRRDRRPFMFLLSHFHRLSHSSMDHGKVTATRIAPATRDLASAEGADAVTAPALLLDLRLQLASPERPLKGDVIWGRFGAEDCCTEQRQEGGGGGQTEHTYLHHAFASHDTMVRRQLWYWRGLVRLRLRLDFGGVVFFMSQDSLLR